MAPTHKNLVGRDAELARLQGVLDAAPGAAVIVTGPPGTGKSALLGALDVRGRRTLEVTGVETEVDVALGGLQELLRPLAGEIAALGGTSVRLLTAALGPGGGHGGDAPPVALAYAVLDLLEAAGPLVMLVDDAQWLDPATRTVLAITARRATRAAVAVVVVQSLRGGSPGDWSGVERLLLGDLARHDALALARRQGLTTGVAEALVDAVGGNPLALVQAPLQLTDDQRTGRALLPAALPAGQRLQELAAARVARLGADARHALLLAAASADGALAPVVGALEGHGGLGALLAAEDTGLVELAPARVRFSHPSMRSAVYHAASPSRRRAAHQALAQATDGPHRAWHRAVAAPTPDEGVAAELAALARDAQRRGAPATAAATFHRAAELTPDPGVGLGRLLSAAAATVVAGDPERALRLLDPLVATLEDPERRADVQLLRGMAMLKAGRPAESFALLEDEAERVRRTDPGRAGGLLVQACVALVSYGSIDRLAEATARFAALLPPALRVVPETLHAQALVGLGEHAAARRALHGQRVALEALDPVGPFSDLLSVVALCHLWMEDHDIAETRLAKLTRAAREQGSIDALALPLAIHSGLHRRRGAWDLAGACVTEALALVEDGDLNGFAASFTFAMAALLAGQRGEDELCAAHAARVVEQGRALQVTTTLACADQALGQLSLGRGDVERAVVHLTRAREHQRALGWADPSQLYTPADLVEALLRCERPAEATEATEELAADAARTGGAWAAAATARCRALLATDDALDGLLAQALAAHARVTLPFELARTELVFGERLRRARRRADARPLLGAAHATFAGLGSEPWAARAAAELAACGGRPRRPAAPASPAAEDRPWPSAGLTAREREVCELVAAGASNREVAQALYVSPRTVEHHLRHAYRKLGLRSRTELVRHVLDAAH